MVEGSNSSASSVGLMYIMWVSCLVLYPQIQESWRPRQKEKTPQPQPPTLTTRSVCLNTLNTTLIPLWLPKARICSLSKQQIRPFVCQGTISSISLWLGVFCLFSMLCDSPFPVNTRRWTNAVLMLAHRLWRWASIKPALVQCLVSTVFSVSMVINILKRCQIYVVSLIYVWSSARCVNPIMLSMFRSISALCDIRMEKVLYFILWRFQIS